MKLKAENALPLYYSQVLAVRGIELDPSMIVDTMKTQIHAISKYLGLKKNRDDENGTALVVRDEKGNFILAGVVKYHKPEKEDQAGNWTYEFTFKESAVKDAHQYIISDTSYMEVFKRTLAVHNLFIEDSKYCFDLAVSFFIALQNVLDDNVTSGEECEIELEGFFVAAAAIEGDEKVYNIIPSGEMKRLIKDDSTLEG